MSHDLSPAEQALREAAREYHRTPTRGKTSVNPTKPLSNQRDLSLAYSPGVAYPCLDIEADPSLAVEYTSRGNLVDIIAAMEPTLGGINLEDIKAPECFCIEKKLSERMGIPVFHDDQHGTAIISSAALINGLELVGKRIEDVKVAVSGAGAAALACLGVMVGLGVRKENVFACDSKGVIYEGRPGGYDESKARFA